MDLQRLQNLQGLQSPPDPGSPRCAEKINIYFLLAKKISSGFLKKGATSRLILAAVHRGIHPHDIVESPLWM